MRNIRTTILIRSFGMICAFGMFPNVGIAQDDGSLRREMLLEAEYTPVIQDANKVNALPPVEDPKPVKATIEYAPWAKITSPPDEAAQFRAEQFGTTAMLYDKRGYITLGGGNWLNLQGAAGYEILNTEKNYLRISANSIYTNRNVRYLQDDRAFWQGSSSQKAKLNDNLLNALFRHRFNYFDLDASVNYEYTGFNYYGYQDTSITSGVIVEKMQTFQLLNPSVVVKSTHDGKFNYYGIVSYSQFSKKYGMYEGYKPVSEKDIFTRLNLTGNFDGTVLGVNSYMHNLFYQSDTWDIMSELGMLDEVFRVSDYTVFCMTPHIEKSGERYKLHAGIEMGFATSKFQRKLSFAPDIEAEYDLSKGTWMYLHVGGGKEVYTMAGIAKENRYLHPDLKPKDAHTPLDARAGFRLSKLEKWFFNVYARYKITDDMHFYYRDYNDSHWFGQQVTEHFSNAFECGLYKKSHLKQAGGQITFNHREQVAVSLKLAKSFWDNEATLSLVGHDENTMKITKPINVPDLEANLSVDVAVLPQMKVNLEYELQSGRYGLAPNFSVLSTFSGEPWLKREKMKDIHNVTLRGNYVFNKSFSIYVQMSNLLNQKYDYWYTYPEQGIGAVGGFTFVF